MIVDDKTYFYKSLIDAGLEDVEDGAVVESFRPGRLNTADTLPSRTSSLRSINNNSANARRRSSARRASLRNDIELLDFASGEDGLTANPAKNMTRPMSERRQYR